MARRLAAIVMFVGVMWLAGCGRIGYDPLTGDGDGGGDTSFCTGDCQCAGDEGYEFDCSPSDGTCTLECERIESCSMLCPPNVGCNVYSGGDVCLDQTGNRGSVAACQGGSCSIVPM